MAKTSDVTTEAHANLPCQTLSVAKTAYITEATSKLLLGLIRCQALEHHRITLYRWALEEGRHRSRRPSLTALFTERVHHIIAIYSTIVRCRMTDAGWPTMGGHLGWYCQTSIIFTYKVSGIIPASVVVRRRERGCFVVVYYTPL